MLPSLSRRRIARLWLAAAIALGATPALAGDKPATPEGAEQLKSFFAKLLPGAAAGAPSLLTVTPEGADYRITFDLSAVNSLIKATGSSYDPATIIYKVVEQDDGNWRVILELPAQDQFSDAGSERRNRDRQLPAVCVDRSRHCLFP